MGHDYLRCGDHRDYRRGASLPLPVYYLSIVVGLMQHLQYHPYKLSIKTAKANKAFLQYYRNTTALNGVAAGIGDLPQRHLYLIFVWQYLGVALLTVLRGDR